jgi:hypothetical protein
MYSSAYFQYCNRNLIKLHWILNINHTIQLENLMYFLELIFKLNKENKNSVY